MLSCAHSPVNPHTHVRVKSRPKTVAAVPPRDTMVIMSLASRRTVRVSLLRAGMGEQQGATGGTSDRLWTRQCWWCTAVAYEAARYHGVHSMQ